MGYTTPPRPVDIAALFPELRAYAATVTRLHPRPGDPGPSPELIATRTVLGT